MELGERIVLNGGSGVVAANGDVDGNGLFNDGVDAELGTEVDLGWRRWDIENGAVRKTVVAGAQGGADPLYRDRVWSEYWLIISFVFFVVAVIAVRRGRRVEPIPRWLGDEAVESLECSFEAVLNHVGDHSWELTDVIVVVGAIGAEVHGW